MLLRIARAFAPIMITLNIFTVQSSSADSASIVSTGEVRCGWFDNPSPNNAMLLDTDGEWTISRHGGAEPGHEATGDWPTFKNKNFVRTGNGSYGYGCACMKVTVITRSEEIANIVWAKERPLNACRNDSKIKKSEPFNPELVSNPR